MPKSSNLSINLPALSKERTRSSGALRSPPISPPYVSPHSPGDMNGKSVGGAFDPPHSPITALPQPQPPQSPKFSERSKSIFSTKAFSKSQSRLAQETSHRANEPVPVYQHSKTPGSTPELGPPETSSTSDPASPRAESSQPNASVKSNSEPHLISDPAEFPRGSKRGERKHKLGQMLTRTKSIGHRDQSPSARGPIVEDDSVNPMPMHDMNGLKTAPLEMKPQDRRFRDMMSGKPRTRSADRSTRTADGNDSIRTPSKERREVASQPSARDSATSGNFFHGIRNSKSRASDLGKAGRGLFGKLTRSGSGHDRDDDQPSMPDLNPDTYKATIIRMGLIDQTRATRISKRLESSRDKTEFWLPALPWRCIDYLNLKGLDVEGLYRVSGSLREIKRWQMRFDLEKDVDLIAEKDLYDVNIIASLLKDWLRNLPEEIFPLTTQHEIQKAAPDAGDRCPPELSAALSQLPPFNYYLLFAITCHLSLLTSCYEKTKMDFDNLCVCIQPSLNIDRFIFKILIKDWRNCWQGCYTEKAYLEKENEWLATLKATQLLGTAVPAGASATQLPQSQPQPVLHAHSHSKSQSQNPLQLQPQQAPQPQPQPQPESQQQAQQQQERRQQQQQKLKPQSSKAQVQREAQKEAPKDAQKEAQEEPAQPAAASEENRATSSAGSTRPTQSDKASGDEKAETRPQQKDDGATDAAPPASATTTVPAIEGDASSCEGKAARNLAPPSIATPSRMEGTSRDAPMLSPYKPLSPIGPL